MRGWKKARKVQLFDTDWIKTQNAKVIWPVALWRMFKK